MATGKVFDIQRYSIHDGPGIRTTVFLKGCPLSCKWCHNPEGQSGEPELTFREGRCGRCGACLAVCKHGAIAWGVESPGESDSPGESGTGRPGAGNERSTDLGAGVPVTDRTKCRRCGECVTVCFAGARQLAGKEMSVEQVMSEVERDVPFYEESGGGVTLSGGEPLAQAGFAAELLQASRRKGIHTVLDTCGFAEWSVLNLVRRHVSLFLYDLKLMDDLKHQEFIGVSNERIVRNLRELTRLGHDVVLRVPIIPGVNSDDDSVLRMGAFAASLPHLISVDVLPYHHIGAEKYRRLGRPYSLADLTPPSKQRMAEITGILAGFGLRVNRRADAD